MNIFVHVVFVFIFVVDCLLWLALTCSGLAVGLQFVLAVALGLLLVHSSWLVVCACCCPWLAFVPAVACSWLVFLLALGFEFQT